MTTQTVAIVKSATGEAVREFDVTGRTERQIDKLIDGISINLDHENYHVEERPSADADAEEV